MATAHTNGGDRISAYDENYSPESTAIDLSSYLQENPYAGVLKISTTAGKGLVPLEGSRVYVSKMLGGDRVMLFKGLTDESGLIENIVLPAPSRENSIVNEDGSVTIPYAKYDVQVDYPEFQTAFIYDVPIFEGIKSIRNIELSIIARGENADDNTR